MMDEGFIIRHAKIKDVKQIQELIAQYASKGEMLPRSLADLYEGIRNFWVAEHRKKIIAVGALAVCWSDLAEVKSLAVHSKFAGRGLGRKLVQKCIEEAKILGIPRLFALTYKPVFFGKIGFKKISRNKLPHKVWNECIRCVKFPNCDENAMLLEIK